MKRYKSSMVWAITALSLLATPKLLAQAPVGQWDFDNGNLNATVGSNLTYADSTATQAGTKFGTTTSFGIPDIGGAAANVMNFPAAINGGGYLMPTPASGNGGGSQVNEWTLVMDVLYPSASDGKLRPIINTDGDVLVAGPDFAISTTGGIGAPPDGPFSGTILPNTWYRIGIVVSTTQIATYINGVQVGVAANPGLDNRWTLAPGSAAPILGTTGVDAAAGYVNSIQLRSTALNAGQMLALGGPSPTGVPQTIPPVPSFIESRTPAANAVDVNPSSLAVQVTLNQGDAVVTSSSIKLLMDGSDLNATVTPSAPTFNVAGAVPGMLDPKSLHVLTLQWQDNKAGARSESWSFTVQDYQKVNLPAPFYLETFDELSEDGSGPSPLPAGWTNPNQSSPGNPGFSLDDRNSDSYLSWVLISESRFSGWNDDRTMLPPIILNGTQLTSLASNSLMWAESDSRCGGCQGQYQELYTADINCTGKSNVFVAFKSIYEQNQDNMNLVEYSVDKGATWNPVRYLFCTAGNGEASDIIYTNDPSGTPVIDVGQTFSRVDNNRNWAPDAIGGVHATNYGVYVKAPINSGMIPYIIGYTNDSKTDGKEIVVVRLPKADNAAAVRFRFLATGTSAWFWGIDDLGLYQINTPTISQQPADKKINAGETVAFTVDAASAASYQWKHAGTNVIDGGHFSGAKTATLTVTSADLADAGSYQVVVSNPFGNVNSTPVRLSVVTAPEITVQPITTVATLGRSASLSAQAMGRPPLQYQWYRDTTAVGGNSNLLSFAAVQASDSGSYKLVVTNADGTATSTIVRLIVTPAAITSGLVVHLPLDGNYNDTSGKGNNATASGSPTFSPGLVGQAMRFTTLKDGSKFDYASLGYPDDLKFGSDVDFSISMWVNYTTSVDDPAFISNKNWSSSNNKGWGWFSQDGGNSRANVTGTGGTKYDSTSSLNIRNGQWHHLAMSYVRQGMVTLYIDGIPVSTLPDKTTGSIDTDDLAYTVNIGQDGTGAYTDGGSAEITALVDDVGIWRRPLSGDEALAIYSAGLATNDLSKAVVPAQALPPAISQQPASATLEEDLVATFSVRATGTPPLTYQWLFNGSPIAAATTDTLTVQHITSANAGSYIAKVTNGAGTSTSSTATLTVTPATPVSITGQWDFNSGNLAATVGTPLDYFDSTVQADTQFGTTTSFGIADIGGAPAKVLKLTPSIPKWGGYKMTHGAAPNGGGVYVNRYTVIYDVYYPASSDKTWRSLLQTSTTDVNDGDFFINTANGIGISSDYVGVVAPDKWNRIVGVFNLPYKELRRYINGTMVGAMTLGAGTDGRWSLDPLALLFGDEDGDTAPGYVNSVQFRNGIMTDTEVAALGGVTQDGIPGMKPSIGSIKLSGTSVVITWAGTPTTKLQQNNSFDATGWTDVPNTLGASSATLPTTGTAKFFRLAQ